jgi:hypothetical protein
MKRIRRIKCDETKPTCLRCTSTGRTCDGYPAVSTNQQWEIITATSVPSLIQLTGNLKLAADGNAGICLQFFRTHTVTYLSSIFKSEFWDQIILRAAHHNNAILHAAIAVGSAHKNLVTRANRSVSTDDEWAVQQYNKAIRSLTTTKETAAPQSLDVILAVCVLFTCFEVCKFNPPYFVLSITGIKVLRRQHGQAITHVQGGINILAEQQSWRSKQTISNGKSESMIPFDQLIAVFSCLETQLCRLAQPIPYLFLALTQSPKSVDEVCVDARAAAPLSGFNSFDGAWNTLNGFWHDLMAVIYQASQLHDPSDEAARIIFVNRQQNLLCAFSEWNTAFRLLLQEQPITTSSPKRDKRAAALLEANYLVGLQILETLTELGEMCWDRYLPNFERVTQLAAVVAGKNEDLDDGVFEAKGNPRLPTPKVSSDRKVPVLSLDHGIVPMLFHVVWKCRDAAVRKLAITILEEYPRLEGLWDGLLVAAVGRRIDEIERHGVSLADAAEKREPQDVILEWSRILLVDVTFNADGKEATLAYLKPRSEVDSTVIRIQETLTW